MLALASPLVVLGFLVFDATGDLHVSVAGVEAFLLCWAATAATPTGAAMRLSLPLLGIVAVLALAGVTFTVHLPSWLGPETGSPETVLLLTGLLAGVIAAALGVAARAAVRTPAGPGRTAAVIGLAVPFVLDLWPTLRLIGDDGEVAAGLWAAGLVCVLSAAWLLESIVALRASGHDIGDEADEVRDDRPERPAFPAHDLF